jgi:putative hydrolase of the HAD superfamily
VPADAVLHVGDDAALDVAGAHAAGMQSAWVARVRDDGSLPGWLADHGAPPHLTVAHLGALCVALQAGQPPAAAAAETAADGQ